MKMKSAAHSSGMRGNEKAAEGEENLSEGSSEQQDGEELGTTVAEHIHGPDENGHHHLNLTTLGEHFAKKKGGEHDK